MTPPFVVTYRCILQNACIAYTLVNNVITDPPGARRLELPAVTCDSVNKSYQVSLKWNDNDTGGANITSYTVGVTGLSEFTCPQAQCNVATNTTLITGLSCSSNYSFTVRAVNCNGSSNANDPMIIEGAFHWLIHVVRNFFLGLVVT